MWHALEGVLSLMSPLVSDISSLLGIAFSKTGMFISKQKLIDVVKGCRTEAVLAGSFLLGF